MLLRPYHVPSQVLPSQSEWSSGEQFRQCAVYSECIVDRIVGPVASGSKLNEFLPPPTPHALHRANTARKPLRSSPLAGPALSSDRAVVSLNDGEGRVPRVSSSPSITARPLSMQLRSKSSQSITRPHSMISIYSPSSSAIPPLPQDAPKTYRRPTTPTSTKRPLSEIRLKRPASAVYSPADSADTTTPKDSPGHNVTRQLQGSASVGDIKTHRDPHLRYSVASNVGSSLSVVHGRPVSVIEAAGSTHSAPPADNTWYVANTYAVTPKFSRLGLSGSNVVMPVSAKDHKKQQHSRSSSASSMPSTPTKSASRRSSISFSLKRHPNTLNAREPVPSVPPLPTHIQIAAQAHDHLQVPRPTSASSSSATSSTCSLALSPPSSGILSHATTSVNSSCTSINDSEETATQYSQPQIRTRLFSISGRSLSKRKSVIARVKSWRRPLTKEHMDDDDNDKPPLPRASDGSVSFPSSVHDLRESIPAVYVTPDHESVVMNVTEKGEKERRGEAHRERIIADASPLKEVVEGGAYSEGQKLRKSGTVRRLWKALIGGGMGATATTNSATKH